MKISGNKLEIDKQSKVRLLLGLVLIASPWILLFITTNLLARHSVFNSVPCWSDELAYWHEILSFSQKGFDFGYYSMNELLPKYLSFGSHGFGAISVYALFGKIVGWKTYSIVIANAFFMSLAFLFLNLLVKLSSKQLLLILIFGMTYTPLILFSSTSMTELLNYSVLIVYFGLLYVYFKRSRKSLLLFLLLFCTVISFIRIIYIILFLPLLFKRNKEFKFDLKFLVYFSLWILFSALLFVFNNLFVSPYPNSFLNELLSSNGFSEFVSNFVVHFIQNSLSLFNPVSENAVQVLGRYFCVFVCVICLIKSNLIQTRFKKFEAAYFIVFLILFLFLLVNIAAYDVFDWRDYRVMAPVLFGSVLFLILNEKQVIFSGFLAFNLLGIVLLLMSPQILTTFNANRYIKPARNPLFNQIEYRKHPGSRFENTIVVQQFDVNTVLNIPAGIGITCSDTLSDKLNSKYIYSKNKQELLTYKIIDSNESGFLYQKIPDK
jgi:hypothetical protein